ncbi:MAG: SPOR domain-containing protein [Candidatus Marinimicrobia bacterium]|nr:SPOR domain-containing protein [Candidatus Neomarinimicrobiota bacterium]
MKLSAYFSLLLPVLIVGQNFNDLDESFDPTTLKDWGESKVRIEQIRSVKDYYKELGDTKDSLVAADRSEYVFRVQLTSTNDYENAKAIEERAITIFDEDIMIQFDSPYYKIRVGSMNNREDAQKLQSFAMQKGYRRAWVIRTKNSSPTKN